MAHEDGTYGSRGRVGVLWRAVSGMSARARRIDRLLGRPHCYRLVQALLAPGTGSVLARRLAARPSVRSGLRCLDVGCGPASWLWRVGAKPIGLDCSLQSAAAFRRRGGVAVAASADALPFRDHRFDLVYSFGLLHHLDEETARRAVREMIRVTSPEGETIVVDAVRPERAWRRPVAWALRRLDRGGWVRSQAGIEALLPDRAEWSCERFAYAWTGLEGVWCMSVRRSALAEGA